MSAAQKSVSDEISLDCRRNEALRGGRIATRYCVWDTVKFGRDNLIPLGTEREWLMFNSKALSGRLLMLAAVLATGACDRAQHYTDVEHVQKATAFQDQGKLDSALVELKNALQKNPKNAEARWRLGEIYISQELGEEAEGELKRARELGMDYEALKVPMGQALLLQGLYGRVMQEVHRRATCPRSLKFRVVHSLVCTILKRDVSYLRNLRKGIPNMSRVTGD